MELVLTSWQWLPSPNSLPWYGCIADGMQSRLTEAGYTRSEPRPSFIRYWFILLPFLLFANTEGRLFSPLA
jgi:hypothetical protein